MSTVSNALPADRVAAMLRERCFQKFQRRLGFARWRHGQRRRHIAQGVAPRIKLIRAVSPFRREVVRAIPGR